MSNIAWAPQDRLAAYDRLAAVGFQGLEIAPGLFFHEAEDPFAPAAPVLDRALGEVAERGLDLVSMQSLLFGVQGAAMFEGALPRQRFETGMRRAIALAGRVGIPNLVFGSPGQRNIPADMPRDRALEEAAALFRSLGDAALDAGTVLTVESNPAAYGTNFLTTLAEAHDFVRLVDHMAVKVILDLGAMHMNGDFDSVPAWIDRLRGMLNHVHVSEPQLAPAPADADRAGTVMAALRNAGYAGAVSIEMKPPGPGPAAIGDCAERLAQAAEARIR